MIFFPHRLTTTFIQIGKIRQSFAVGDFSNKINDDIYQIGKIQQFFNLQRSDTHFSLLFLHLSPRKLLSAEHRARLPGNIKKKEKDTHIIG
jgi:hypothetical protein